MPAQDALIVINTVNNYAGGDIQVPGLLPGQGIVKFELFGLNASAIAQVAVPGGTFGNSSAQGWAVYQGPVRPGGPSNRFRTNIQKNGNVTPLPPFVGVGGTLPIQDTVFVRGEVRNIFAATPGTVHYAAHIMDSDPAQEQLPRLSISNFVLSGYSGGFFAVPGAGPSQVPVAVRMDVVDRVISLRTILNSRTWVGAAGNVLPGPTGRSETTLRSGVLSNGSRPALAGNVNVIPEGEAGALLAEIGARTVRVQVVLQNTLTTATHQVNTSGVSTSFGTFNFPTQAGSVFENCGMFSGEEQLDIPIEVQEWAITLPPPSAAIDPLKGKQSGLASNGGPALDGQPTVGSFGTVDIGGETQEIGSDRSRDVVMLIRKP